MGERIRRSESHSARAREPSQFRRSWLPERTRRAVVLVHGLGEHSGRYEELGAFLARQGSAVYGYDHRGHGRSGGEVCHVDHFGELLDDLAGVLEDVAGLHAGAPLHLLGHSMGGLVAAAFLAERSPPLASAVLSAPALAAEGEAPTGMRRGRLLRRIRPRHRIRTPVDPEDLSTDPAVAEAYVADPLVRHETMTISLALELLSGMALADPGRIDVPTLVLHGGDDRICPAGPSEAFARGLPRGRYVGYPGLRHEILNEPSRGEIYHEILRWLEAAEESSR